MCRVNANGGLFGRGGEGCVVYVSKDDVVFVPREGQQTGNRDTRARRVEVGPEGGAA